MDTVDISSRAAEYAGGKAVDCLTKAIEQAYKDGYLDGFKDGKELASDCISTGEVNYVDLGLPSGTLWSDDYVMRDGEVLYWAYGEASKKSIPSEEQFNELLKNCEWRCAREGKLLVAKCIGPNGNVLRFRGDGKLEGDVCTTDDVYFWLLSDIESENMNKRTAGYMWLNNEQTKLSPGRISCFVGMGLPLRLVKSRD